MSEHLALPGDTVQGSPPDDSFSTAQVTKNPPWPPDFLEPCVEASARKGSYDSKVRNGDRTREEEVRSQGGAEEHAGKAGKQNSVFPQPKFIQFH